ncbi:hypothetical protein E1263_41840 [Kribbella antibiotica]|uniref:Catalase n=1 Tax=Kribbella antibiotica TaxID=190195 RepID=A0A4R4YGL1_9ACTN|nr:hypothetical protein [Kribbella antibiotica]TDD43124.1 hypothetical protein E1263_41840 [Kribbella antibiotica]
MTEVEPSTEWREVVGADEAERHKTQAEGFVAMQLRKSGKYGGGRALHRRQVAALRARLEVVDELPEYARQGLFAVPGSSFETWLRISNGGFNVAADKAPDVRGFSLKVLGVTGQGALGGEAKSQDFALINHEHFSSATSVDFSSVVLTTGSTPGGAIRKIIGSPSLIPKVKEVVTALREPFSGFATHDFFSAAPVAYGPYAVRVRIAAASDQVDSTASADWGADLFRRLAVAPLVYELQVQFFQDEATTPIENAAATWTSPYLTVARLTVPQQEPDEEFAQTVEDSRFDPWNALVEHRPLGEVMRARKVAYFASQQARGAK